jgi:hypothetical protein
MNKFLSCTIYSSLADGRGFAANYGSASWSGAGGASEDITAEKDDLFSELLQNQFVCP